MPCPPGFFCRGGEGKLHHWSLGFFWTSSRSPGAISVPWPSTYIIYRGDEGMMKSIMESVAICCVGLFCVVFCSINRWLEMLWVFLFCKQKKASLLGPRAWDHAFSKGLFTNLSDLTLSVMVDKIRHLVGWLYTLINVGHHPDEFPLGRLFLADVWERWDNSLGRSDIPNIFNTVESFKHPITYLVVPRWAGWKLSYLHIIYIFILYDALICYVILVAHAEVIFFKLFLFVERERHDLWGFSRVSWTCKCDEFARICLCW